MESGGMEQTMQLYNRKLRRPHMKKSAETTETMNDSLPAIPKPKDKVNVVRGQLNETNSQIMLMEAKLTALRHMKQKMEKKNQRHNSQIQFISNVKERVRRDAQEKERHHHMRQQSLENLQMQTKYVKEAMEYQRRSARQEMFDIKDENARAERERSRHCQFLIQKLRELDMREKAKKVEKVRESEQSCSSRVSRFQTSRVQMSRENYHQRLRHTIDERDRASRTLDTMKSEQERLMSELKASEASMLTSLYNLQHLNPEKSKTFKFSPSRKSIQKEEPATVVEAAEPDSKDEEVDVDDYENEEFES